ncbi:MAG: NAD+ synthase [archaeon]
MDKGGKTTKLERSVLAIDSHWAEDRITRFVRDYVDRTGRKGLVMGISGGVDSSVCSTICARAIGGNNILGLFLPEKETMRKEDMEHARLVAELSDMEFETVDVTSPTQTIFQALSTYDTNDKVANGNVRARLRMIVLYYYANRLGRLVAGSSDKSEAMLGYFTKWGDVCADISPVMDLYKTQVRHLGRHLGLPDAIVNKPATPSLWPGQTAEDELGLDYDTLDLILYGLEHWMSSDEISAQLGLSLDMVKAIEDRWLGAEHKRRLPLTAKIGFRSIGHDFRLPYALPKA